MALSNGYVGRLRCNAETDLPGMRATATCSLDLGHVGLHYWATDFPDMHVAVSWHALDRDPAPDSAQPEGEGTSQLAPSHEVGNHHQGAGS